MEREHNKVFPLRDSSDNDCVLSGLMTLISVLQRFNLLFFIQKTFKKVFWQTIDLVKNLEMMQIAGGRGGVMFFASL